MNSFKNKMILILFLTAFFIAPIYSSSLINFEGSYSQDNSYFPQTQAINRTGKIFSNTTRINKDCYINREQPNLNNQPEILIPNYNISHATMSFENITAINYTRYIEDDFSEFIFSSENGPTYIYQKFSVEINQYINNISVLIQDINNPLSFTEENSWEVAVVNCTNDGTPNSEEILSILKKPHPLVYAAHWEVFDFKNAGSGPIYLDTAKTYMTMESGTEKYWFAYRIKIPQDDSLTGGGPKFLYFNPDGGDANDIGEGNTFAISPDFYFDDYTVNNVITSQVTNGSYYEGTPDSFDDVDDNRYLAGDANNATIEVTFELQELKNSPYTFGELFVEIYKQFSDSGKKDFNWWFDHYQYIFSFDFSLMVNVSDESRIHSANLSIYDYKVKKWETLPYDIIDEMEYTLNFSIRSPWEKYLILQYMDNFPIGNNILRFKLEYIGTGEDFNVSVNQFKVEVGELVNLDTIQPHDPLVQELYFSNDATVINQITPPLEPQTIESLQYNDEDYFKAQAHTSNLSFFFTYNVLNDIDSDLWNVDYYDWVASYPNPIVPLMDIRLTSNVSKPDNLEFAALVLYKGKTDFDIFDDATNNEDLLLMSRAREFAHSNETTTVFPFDAGFTWIFLNILNESRNNEVLFILIYQTNESADHQFIVSINEFSVNFYIQNAISSDISSSLGLGINSNTLTASEIGLQNFGVDVTDNGIGKGTWEADIDNADFSQGFFKFNVTSKWHSIRFDVNGTYEIFKIEPIMAFIEPPASQYMTGTRFFSARVFEPGGKPLENVEIIFEVLNVNNITLYETTAVTNDQGIATSSLKFENTGSKFSVRARFAEEGMYTSAEIVSGYIKVVSEFTLFMDTLMRYLPYIIVGLAAAITFVSVRHIRHSRQRKFWAGEARILDDLLKIAYIMIIDKNAGVSIYDKQISLEGIDSDLISGFLQAISHFRSEIKKDTEGSSIGKGFEMDYYDFKIVITDGNYVRVALILDGIPSEKLKESQIAFTSSFERRFEPNLKNFMGEVTPFRATDDLIEKFFNVTFVYPLQLGKHYGVVKLKGLEKDLTEVAEQIQKERKFFFVSSLLSFGLAGRKASRDEIISTIISLKRKGLIIPAELQ